MLPSSRYILPVLHTCSLPTRGQSASGVSTKTARRPSIAAANVYANLEYVMLTLRTHTGARRRSEKGTQLSTPGVGSRRRLIWEVGASAVMHGWILYIWSSRGRFGFCRKAGIVGAGELNS